MSEVKIGIIGTGNIGKEHIKAFQQLENITVEAVTDTYLPGAQQTAKQFDIPKVFPSVDELLKDSSIEAVVISVPNKFHAQLTIQSLEHGKHVLLEKPMALSLEDAKSIVAAQRATGGLVMISHQMRWEWEVLQLKEQVDKGAFGRIYHAKAGWMRRKGIPGWGTWFTRKEFSGGGPLIDIGVHMLDLTLHLMGDVKPVSVFGSTYAEFGPKKRGLGDWGTPDWNGTFDVEDLASAFIKMEDGSSLTLDVSWAAHTSFNTHPFVHILGTEGGASFVSGQGTLVDRTI